MGEGAGDDPAFEDPPELGILPLHEPSEIAPISVSVIRIEELILCGMVRQILIQKTRVRNIAVNSVLIVRSSFAPTVE